MSIMYLKLSTRIVTLFLASAVYKSDRWLVQMVKIYYIPRKDVGSEIVNIVHI